VLTPETSEDHKILQINATSTVTGFGLGRGAVNIQVIILIGLSEFLPQITLHCLDIPETGRKFNKLCKKYGPIALILSRHFYPDSRDFDNPGFTR